MKVMGLRGRCAGYLAMPTDVAFYVSSTAVKLSRAGPLRKKKWPVAVGYGKMEFVLGR